MQKGESDNFYPHLIAKKLGVDANTVAATDLDWQTGCDLSNHVPIHAIIRFASGDLTACVVEIKADSVLISDAVGLTGCAVAVPNIVVDLAFKMNPITNDNTKVIKADVTIPSTNPGTFDIFVYGTQFN